LYRADEPIIDDEQHRLGKLEKTFTDYQAQANGRFEQEVRLKELLARQAQLNAALDLDKSDAQASAPAEVTIQPPAELRQQESTPANAVRPISLPGPRP
jgi:hypothetical protein